MKEFFFDLETTGLKHWKNGVHQIAGAIVIDGIIKEEFDYKVRPNPKAEIDPESLDVGGVTLEQIMEYPPMEEVYKGLTVMLGRYVDKYNKRDKFWKIGYNNAAFDDNFFRAFFVQNGDNYFGSWFWADPIDVRVLAAKHLMEERSNMPNFKLGTVAQHLGVDVDNAMLHDGVYDIRLTMEVYKKL